MAVVNVTETACSMNDVDDTLDATDCGICWYAEYFDKAATDESMHFVGMLNLTWSVYNLVPTCLETSNSTSAESATLTRVYNCPLM